MLCRIQTINSCGAAAVCGCYRSPVAAALRGCRRARKPSRRAAATVVIVVSTDSEDALSSVCELVQQPFFADQLEVIVFSRSDKGGWRSNRFRLG